jgi:hypothetical protein
MRIVLPLMHRRRNPIAQAISLVLGLVVIGVLLVFGLVVAGVLMVGGALWLVWRQLEGEYVVIRDSRPVAH